MNNTPIPPHWYTQYNQRGFPKEKLLHYLRLLPPYFKHPHTPQFALQQALNWGNLLAQKLPSYDLIIGSGYPYYVLDINDHHIPEYDRFFTEMAHKAEKLEGDWACPACVREHPRGNFDEYCAPCQSPFKALDMFYSLPDIDLLLVLPEISDSILQEIEPIVFQLSGFEKPDEDLETAVKNLQHTMETVLANKSGGFLRPDVFVLSQATYLQAYEQLAYGNLLATNTDLWALHNIWVPFPTNLATDFLVTGQRILHSQNPPLLTFAQECVQKFVSKFSAEEIMNQFLTLWATHYPKNYRIITSSAAISAGVKQKFERLKTELT